MNLHAATSPHTVNDLSPTQSQRPKMRFALDMASCHRQVLCLTLRLTSLLSSCTHMHFCDSSITATAFTMTRYPMHKPSKAGNTGTLCFYVLPRMSG